MRDRIAWLEGDLRTAEYPRQSTHLVVGPGAPPQSTAAVPVSGRPPANVQRPPQVQAPAAVGQTSVQRQRVPTQTTRIIDRARPVARASVPQPINRRQEPIQPTSGITNRRRRANLRLRRTVATPLVELSPTAQSPTVQSHAVHSPTGQDPAAQNPATRSPGAESTSGNAPPPYTGDMSQTGASPNITYEAFSSRIAELQADVVRSNRASDAAWEALKASQIATAEAEARLAILERRAHLKSNRRSWQFWRRGVSANE